ncbi:BC1872 family protein [Robertmurraya andreesenii]|uniref:Phage ABA sandwich domain-containing protein n=1 Tax=Anoxybacillus andreesenii TaxID=1325932 RepID=A0ABT9V1J8_9BACL|nr:hypothetical protein [Robertmurraya andreesenii]MDQ0154786.1 hypothetical protein [Robertmurraya andreesenii]
MDKIEVIARRIMDWKLNRWDRWYDHEKEIFIENFRPDENLEHAKLVVTRLEELGFSYQVVKDFEVCFNHFCGSGNTLAQAITNAAFAIADNTTVPEEWL